MPTLNSWTDILIFIRLIYLAIGYGPCIEPHNLGTLVGEIHT